MATENGHRQIPLVSVVRSRLSVTLDNLFHFPKGALSEVPYACAAASVRAREAYRKRLDMDDRTETLIRSLKRSGSDYSEVFIKGPETEAIGRLVLDDYSATLFSSSPQTFAAIDAEIARGYQLADAIERIAFANR